MRRSMLRLTMVSMLVAGCTDEPPQPMSWDDFRDATPRESHTGFFIVDGDEVVYDLDGLRPHYDEYVASFHAHHSNLGVSEQGLLVNLVDGAYDKWSPTAARNLTYCVSRKAFGERYSMVVASMARAASAWEAVANVNFIHLRDFDTLCTANTSAVVFNVDQVSGQEYLARAFYPSSPRSARNVLLDKRAFGDISPWTLPGILRHELGHSLGFRHEHDNVARSWAFHCYEGGGWAPLTPYDASSVMHYPQCNGRNLTGDLVLTSYDALGARTLYP